MDVNKKILELRRIMKSNSVDALIIPSSDPHQSEYVADHWQERAWISGFTGSAGTVAITLDHAGLWTDSRYYLQGAMQLTGTEMVLHKMGNQFAAPFVDFLAEELPKDGTVAINGLMFSKSSVEAIKKTLSARNINLIHRMDLISEIWSDRPALSEGQAEIHETKYTGKSIDVKLNEIREAMTTSSADFHLITALDDVAWTFNLRGKDVEYNPVVIAYAVVGKDAAHIFIDGHKLSPKIISVFSNTGVKIHDYDKILGFLNQLPEKSSIVVDQNLCSITLYEAINAQIVHSESIPKRLKAIKNEVEQSCIRSVMKKDGAALAKAFYFLENLLKSGKEITEVDFAKKLAEFRSQHKHYQGESFGAIVGYKENGAIIHYHPEPKSCKTIFSEGILLVDSGGQYLDGTTDITRTFALSLATSEQKNHYTLILKGMISLSRAIFPEGTSGAQLDTFARQFLWAKGLNYGHGTGHGVGFYLNVHEPPQGFAPVHSERGKTVHLAGMLTSNEPGYYLEGSYGMRIENLIICQHSNMSGFLEFETVTLYPFDHALIDRSLLTKEETSWINDYHKKVYAGVSPYLKGELKAWFKDKCRRV